MRNLLAVAAWILPGLCFATVTRDGDKVIFNGDVTTEAAAELAKHFDQGARLLVVTSPGGDADAGLRIGQSMLKHGVSIVVDQYCISACANYLFIGAKNKALNDGALLGYHGGIYSEGGKNKTPQSAMTRRHVAFFKSAHVDDALLRKSFELTKLDKPKVKFTLTYEGKTEEFDSMETGSARMAELIRQKIKYSATFTRDSVTEKGVYFPSKASLEKHGVTGIVAYPYPASQQAMTQAYKDVLDGLEPVGDF